MGNGWSSQLVNSITLGTVTGPHIRIGKTLPAELLAAGFQAAIIYFWEGETNGYFYDGIRNPGPLPANAIREWGTVTGGVRIRNTQTQMNGGTPSQFYVGTHSFTSAPETVGTDFLFVGSTGNQFNLGPVTKSGPGTGQTFWGVGTLVVQARRASAVNQGSGAAASWDTLEYGANFMSAGTSFTPPAIGWYEISGKLRMGAQAAGTAQQTFVRTNGVATAGGQNSCAANSSGAAGNSIPIGPEMVFLDPSAGDTADVTGSNALAAALSWAGSRLIIKYFGSSTNGSATPT